MKEQLSVLQRVPSKVSGVHLFQAVSIQMSSEFYFSLCVVNDC